MSIPDFSNPRHFDALVKLARKNPAAFEEFRKRLIEQVINDMPAERRQNMRRFQWRIEQETRNYSCPMGRCIKLSALMVERLDQLSDQIEVLNSPGGNQDKDDSACASATILPMNFTTGR